MVEKGRLLLRAAKDGDVAAIAQLHTLGADLAFANAKGRIALHDAAEAGKVEVVRSLLCLDPTLVNAVTKVPTRTCPAVLSLTPPWRRAAQAGSTALHLAAAVGQTGVVAALLEHGASVQTCDGGGNSAMALARMADHVDTVAVLLHHAEALPAPDAPPREVVAATAAVVAAAAAERAPAAAECERLAMIGAACAGDPCSVNWPAVRSSPVAWPSVVGSIHRGADPGGL